ncbi:MAG: hypothetical protein ACTSUN_07200 [Promethearchaeota archaeon]
MTSFWRMGLIIGKEDYKNIEGLIKEEHMRKRDAIGSSNIHLFGFSNL